jgi:hypothetical protein
MRRIRGDVSDDCFIDHKRSLQCPGVWANAESFKISYREQYQRDLWQDQQSRVLILVEKGTVGDVVQHVTYKDQGRQGLAGILRARNYDPEQVSWTRLAVTHEQFAKLPDYARIPIKDMQSAYENGLRMGDTRAPDYALQYGDRRL